MYNTWKIENGYQVFSCGCKFEVIREREGHVPLVKRGNPYKTWNYECPATQAIMADGKTLGVWQLESPLGQHWCKRLKPENTEHVAALGAILRPGCMEAKDERGVSTTEKYCRYKNNEEIPVPEVAALGPLLVDNYYQMIYQEDCMRISRELAGFNGPQANTLMKGIGKKKPEIIAGLKKEFLEGCAKVGKVNEEEAIKIFENIEKSQRYSFNRSHAVCYGILGQATAFAKAHEVDYFFSAYLEGAEEKSKVQLERYKLVKDSKFFDIDIKRPSLSKSRKWFYSPRKGEILFGLNSVKHVGKKTIDKVKEFNKNHKDDGWLVTLVRCLYMIDSRAAQNIIKAGIIDNGMKRKHQLHEYDILCELTKGQIEFMVENCDKYSTLKELFVAMNKPKKEGGGRHRAKDKEKIDSLIYTIDNPGYPLEDNPEWIASVEEEVLGIALTATLLDGADKAIANTTCKDITFGKDAKNMVIACELDRVEQKDIKTGKNKGKPYLKVDFSDETGTINGVMIWPETQEKFGYLLKEKNTVCLKVYRNRTGDISVSEVYQI
mgnify:FL=1